MIGFRGWLDPAGGRGQSEVLGVVLLLSITVLGTTAIVAVGSSVLADSQQSADIERAEHAMTQLDSQASLVGHGESDSQRVAIGGEGRTYVDEDAGWMNITIETDESEYDPINVTLGAIVYENDGTTIAYQGGGVWKSDGAGSQMVSPPEFHYRDETLTLPLINISNSESHAGDGVMIDRVDDSDQHFPSENVPDRLVGGNVTITVQSEYHEAWGAFFEQRTDAEVHNLEGNRKKIVLPTEMDGSDLTEAMSATGTDAELDLQAFEKLYAESYDSETGEIGNDNATIWTDGDIDSPQGKGQYEEDMITIRGDLLTSGGFHPNENSFESHDAINVTGETISDADPPSEREVTGVIEKRFGEFEEKDLENVATESDEINLKNESRTISEDTYINGSIQLKHEGRLTVDSGDSDLAVEVSDEVEIKEDSELIINTGVEDTTVHLYADDGLTLGSSNDGPGNVTVEGDGTVWFYISDDIEFNESTNFVIEDDANVEMYQDNGGFEMKGGDNGTSTITVENNEAAGQFWLFSATDTVNLDGSDSAVEFTGVLYTPNSNAELRDEITINGSIVVQEYTNVSGADLTLRYDEAITRIDPLADETIPTVNNLHVSVHTVNATAT